MTGTQGQHLKAAARGVYRVAELPAFHEFRRHAKMHGIIRPPDDPIWQIWWPPNGYNCRCKIRIITRAEAERLNIKPSPSIPRVYPDPGFASGPA